MVKNLEKYVWKSSLLVKLQAYTQQRYQKINSITHKFHDFWLQMHSSYFIEFLGTVIFFPTLLSASFTL